MIDKQAYYDFTERKLTCAISCAYRDLIKVSPTYNGITHVGKQSAWVHRFDAQEHLTFLPRTQCHVYDIVIIGKKNIFGDRWMDAARHLMIPMRGYQPYIEALNNAMLGYNWAHYYTSKNEVRDTYFEIGKRLRKKFIRNFDRAWTF